MKSLGDIMMIKNRKIKNYILIVLIGLSIGTLLISGFQQEKTITKVKTSYGRVDFPESITYKGKKGLIYYNVDLKLDKNSIKKDPLLEQYYAEYTGILRSESFNIK